MTFTEKLAELLEVDHGRLIEAMQGAVEHVVRAWLDDGRIEAERHLSDPQKASIIAALRIEDRAIRKAIKDNKPRPDRRPVTDRLPNKRRRLIRPNWL